jgi:hypothetical protein
MSRQVRSYPASRSERDDVVKILDQLKKQAKPGIAAVLLIAIMALNVVRVLLLLQGTVPTQFNA